jgi:hypothetical protein
MDNVQTKYRNTWQTFLQNIVFTPVSRSNEAGCIWNSEESCMKRPLHVPDFEHAV